MAVNQKNDQVHDTQPTSLLPNNIIGTYTLQRRIGSGSFSEIWKASSSELRDGQDVVALKICDKRKLGAENISRLETECLLHSRLDHPNIVKLYEIFEVDKRVFLVIELASKGDVSLLKCFLKLNYSLKCVFLAPWPRELRWSFQ